MVKHLKTILNLISKLLVLPLAVPTKLEQWLISPHTELVYNICSQAVAILPGMPGAFLRRAFYSLTLEECSDHCHIGFGTIISHRSAIIKDHVYIGSYALIGAVEIQEHSLIGSRVSILSGRALHILEEDGTWSAYSPDRLTQITISKNVWVGEGAIIVANIGEGCMIGAGSVITTDTKPQVVMSGNPARFIKNLTPEEG
ncbi:acyltransferase [Marinobacter salinisoli]|uniref:Acyltransferase n=1 Tax=Marinobacter salinisoli TaxID=2769486 RepID=A0ABX7MNK3_9GAMM|nr:acyltransferase [Marinobacter salinisoli]QSP93852.1 acyltransferase [Marinobacter salinisoli]